MHIWTRRSKIKHTIKNLPKGGLLVIFLNLKIFDEPIGAFLRMHTLDENLKLHI